MRNPGLPGVALVVAVAALGCDRKSAAQSFNTLAQVTPGGTLQKNTVQAAPQKNTVQAAPQKDAGQTSFAFGGSPTLMTADAGGSAR